MSTSDAFIRAVRRRLHPDQHIPSPTRQPTAPRSNRGTSTPSSSLDGPSESPDIELLSEPTAKYSNSVSQKRSANAVSSNPNSSDDVCTLPASASASTSAPAPAPAPAPSANPNPSKRKRKERAAPVPSRGARYRAHPSRAVLDRHHRSQRHRLFLIDRNINADLAEGKFAVMGANGNVYQCKIGLEPSCNCPDFTKRADFGSGHGPCKHLIFVFTRVLKVAMDDPVWWQIRLLQDEVTKVLSSSAASNLDNSCLAENSVRDQYHHIQQSQEPPTSSQGQDRQNDENRRPIQGDCPICFEDMTNADQTRAEEVTTFCKTCGNNFHTACFQHWVRGRSNPTCPLCRAAMPSEDRTSSQVVQATQFPNLAQFSTTHAQTMTLAELYADTHQYIGRGGRGGRGRGRGR